MAKSRKNAAYDSGHQHLGTVYGKALLGAAEKIGQTETVLAEFESLVGDVLDKLPQLEALLSAPRVSHEEKLALLDRTFGGKMSPVMLSFLKVVSSHGRLDTLRAILRASQQLYNKMRNRVEVLVETAAPLNNQLQSAINNRLTQVLGREVVLSTDVNPDLLGGLVVRIGDTVYDGSLAGRLNQMRTVTLEHTTQAIRQSADRFALSDTSVGPAGPA